LEKAIEVVVEEPLRCRKVGGGQKKKNYKKIKKIRRSEAYLPNPYLPSLKTRPPPDSGVNPRAFERPTIRASVCK